MDPTFLSFAENVRAKRLISTSDKILAAVSGGADSMTMVNLLIDFFDGDYSRIEVAHLNHNLRGEDSKRDEEFVRNFCEKKGMKFHCLSLDIEELARKEKLSIEDCGRKYRHKFFEDLVRGRKDFKIALAHNYDDQAETILMRLVRGTGVDGLRGMKERDGNIIRPILFLKRSEIESYLEKNHIEFVQDMTNFENDYSRNKYRNILIPYLEETFNPSLKDSLVRLGDIASMEAEFRDTCLGRLYQSCILQESTGQLIFNENRLKELSKSESLQLIRYAIIKLNGSGYSFEYAHYLEMAKVINLDSGKEVKINGISVSKTFDGILIKKISDNDLNQPIEANSTGVYRVNSYRIELTLAVKRPYKIRKRARGDRILLRGKLRKLKDFLIDKKIDRVDRDYLPIIESDGIILAVANLYRNEKVLEDLSININISGG